MSDDTKGGGEGGRSLGSGMRVSYHTQMPIETVPYRSVFLGGGVDTVRTSASISTRRSVDSSPGPELSCHCILSNYHRSSIICLLFYGFMGFHGLSWAFTDTGTPRPPPPFVHGDESEIQGFDPRNMSRNLSASSA